MDAIHGIRQWPSLLYLQFCPSLMNPADLAHLYFNKSWRMPGHYHWIKMMQPEVGHHLFPRSIFYLMLKSEYLTTKLESGF